MIDYKIIDKYVFILKLHPSLFSCLLLLDKIKNNKINIYIIYIYKTHKENTNANRSSSFV